MEFNAVDVLSSSLVTAKQNFSTALKPPSSETQDIIAADKPDRPDKPAPGTPTTDPTDNEPDANSSHITEQINQSNAVAAEAEKSLEDSIAALEAEDVRAAQEETYQQEIEQAEQALRDAALLANEAKQQEALMEIVRDTLDDEDVGADPTYDPATATQKSFEAQTRQAFSAARDTLEQPSKSATGQSEGYYSILI